MFLSKKHYNRKSDKLIKKVMARKVTESEVVAFDLDTHDYNEASIEDLHTAIRLHALLMRSRTHSHYDEKFDGLRGNYKAEVRVALIDWQHPKRHRNDPLDKELIRAYRFITPDSILKWGLGNLTGPLLSDLIIAFSIPKHLISAISANEKLTWIDFCALNERCEGPAGNGSIEAIELLEALNGKAATKEFVTQMMEELPLSFLPATNACKLARKVFKIDESVPDKQVQEMFGVSYSGKHHY